MLKHPFIFLKQVEFTTSIFLSYSLIENHFESAVKETVFQNKCVRQIPAPIIFESGHCETPM